MAPVSDHRATAAPTRIIASPPPLTRVRSRLSLSSSDHARRRDPFRWEIREEASFGPATRVNTRVRPAGPTGRQEQVEGDRLREVRDVVAQRPASRAHQDPEEARPARRAAGRLGRPVGSVRCSASAISAHTTLLRPGKLRGCRTLRCRRPRIPRDRPARPARLRVLPSQRAAGRPGGDGALTEGKYEPDVRSPDRRRGRLLLPPHPAAPPLARRDDLTANTPEVYEMVIRALNNDSAAPRRSGPQGASAPACSAGTPGPVCCVGNGRTASSGWRGSWRHTSPSPVLGGGLRGGRRLLPPPPTAPGRPVR